MGWKLSAIVIKSETVVSDEDLLSPFFEHTPERLEDVYFDSAMYPAEGYVYIGNYKGCTIKTIWVTVLAENYFKEEPAYSETVYSKLFPSCTIGGFLLQSTTSAYAYSVTQSGIRKRVKRSSLLDNVNAMEFGNVLKSEAPIINNSYINKKGERIYTNVDPNNPELEYKEEDIGEELVFSVWSDFFGKRPDDDDELFENVKFRAYKIDNRDLVDEEIDNRTFWQRLFSKKKSWPIYDTSDISPGTKGYKYFEKPELFAVLENCKCINCSCKKLCYSNIGICKKCLSNGLSNDTDSYSTCEGDVKELKRQLIGLNPRLTTAEIEKSAQQKTHELEKTTPPLPNWQHWVWPCHEGDYCRFIGYGSKPFYDKISKDNNGRVFFEDSLYYTVKEDSDGNLWNKLVPDEEIKNHEESSVYAICFYVFKSLHSDKIITVFGTS